MPDFAVFNLATGQSTTMAPLGALYVVAAAEQAGYATSFHDYALETGPDLFSLDRIASFLETEDAPLIGISCFAGMLPYAVGAAQELRRRRPDAKIVFGGPGPSAVAQGLLDRFSAIDFVVYGEGEETVVDLLRSVQTGTPAPWSIPGLVWRAANGIAVQNPPRMRRRELDEIAFPAYSHVDIGKYDVVGVVYARGCPYACTYCDVVSMWKRRNIARSVDNVLAEIAWLHETYAIRHVAFVDDLFTVDRKRTMLFCREFANRGCPTTWGCTTRVDRVDSELLETMGATGCNYVFYGVESGSPSVLARVNKIIPFEHTIEAVKKSAAEGMYVHTPLMWGFPFETLDDFHQTLVFGQYLRHCGANVFYTLATPLPGTALFEEFRERLSFHPEIYSTIVAPGRVADLSPVIDLIRSYPRLFSGFYHFADGLVDEKIEIGLRTGVTLSDIRISNLTRRESASAAH
jgi:radical SAM superfamily enzyme YgiQ (UPF0313 family)